MWVNIEVISGKDDIIYVPKSMKKNFEYEIEINFGKLSSMAVVKTYDETVLNKGNIFEDPVEIRMSSKLASKLKVCLDVTYQIKYSYYQITIGPTIGLLLGNHDYLYNPEHMKKYSDRFGVYEKVGGLIYAFSAKAIDWNELTVFGLYYNNSKNQWQYGSFPIPSVVYRRDFHTDENVIRRLIRTTNGKVFNSWRFGKFYLYNHAKKYKELSRYLPPTELCQSYEQLKRFLDINEGIILKPVDLSRGRGICIVNSEEVGYKISDYRGSEAVQIKLGSESALKDFFENNKCFFNKYLMQKHLALAKIEGSPFDIRVVMQKEKLNQWKCSGIECRVAAQKSLITNISRGGYALTLEEALRRSFTELEEYEREKIVNYIDKLSLKLCESLDKIGKHFAEFGMDLALDEGGNPWIIEVNVFPSFKGFKVMNYDTYLGIRHTPILYAAQLAGFKIY